MVFQKVQFPMTCCICVRYCAIAYYKNLPRLYKIKTNLPLSYKYALQDHTTKIRDGSEASGERDITALYVSLTFI